ncbi:hypothetical protein LINPERHAP2_LOCUS42472 [Linum perenne]
MGKASLFRVSMAVLEGIFAWSFGIISVSYINVPTGRGSFAETLILFGRWLIREVVLLLIVLGAETLIIARTTVNFLMSSLRVLGLHGFMGKSVSVWIELCATLSGQHHSQKL